jgi:hypothetical protein
MDLVCRRRARVAEAAVNRRTQDAKNMMHAFLKESDPHKLGLALARGFYPRAGCLGLLRDWRLVPRRVD